jgi:hypothetical protein
MILRVLPAMIRMVVQRRGRIRGAIGVSPNKVKALFGCFLRRPMEYCTFRRTRKTTFDLIEMWSYAARRTGHGLCDPDFLRSNEATGQTYIFIDDITSMTPHALRYSRLSCHNNERTRPQFDERGVHIATANINRISTPSNKDFIIFKSLFLLIYRRGRARDTPRKHHRLGV